MAFPWVKRKLSKTDSRTGQELIFPSCLWALKLLTAPVQPTCLRDRKRSALHPCSTYPFAVNKIYTIQQTCQIKKRLNSFDTEQPFSYFPPFGLRHYIDANLIRINRFSIRALQDSSIIFILRKIQTTLRSDIRNRPINNIPNNICTR